MPLDRSARLADRRVSIPELTAGSVALLGVPLDHTSSFARGCARAPRKIREALLSPASNLSSETGIDLDSETRLVDAGDLDLPADDGFVEAVERGAGEALDRGAALLALGGDHAITYPLVRAHAARHRRLEVLHLDAHPDLYEELEGSRLSHACPFARILEAGLADRLVQVGIRTMNTLQRMQAERYGVEVIEMRSWNRFETVELAGPLYISLDLDVLDPAFAPGISHREPGGATVRQVIDLIHSLEVPVIGADLVELNPERDPQGVTAVVAAKLVKELAACLLLSGGLGARA